MWECKIAPPVITFNTDMLQPQETVFITLLTKISMIFLPMEAYFQYLIFLNKILQSLNFRIPYPGKKIGGKVTKFFISDYFFPG